MAERHRQRVWVTLLALGLMIVGCANAQDGQRAAGGREASAVTRSAPREAQTSGSSPASSPLKHNEGATPSSDSLSSAALSAAGGSQASRSLDEPASNRRGAPVGSSQFSQDDATAQRTDSSSPRRAPGAPVGEIDKPGRRTGTPIAVLPFDNIGGPLSAFHDAVAFKVEHDCGGDEGCFDVAIAFVDAGEQEPCTVLSIAPNPPRVYGETVTATVSRCESEASETQSTNDAASGELPQDATRDNDAKKPSGGGSGGEGSDGSSLGGNGAGHSSGGSSSGGGGGAGEGSGASSLGGDGAGPDAGEQSSSGNTAVDGAELPASPESGSE